MAVRCWSLLKDKLGLGQQVVSNYIAHHIFSWILFLLFLFINTIIIIAIIIIIIIISLLLFICPYLSLWVLPLPFLLPILVRAGKGKEWVSRCVLLTCWLRVNYYIWASKTVQHVKLHLQEVLCEAILQCWSQHFTNLGKLGAGFYCSTNNAVLMRLTSQNSGNCTSSPK